MPYPTPVALIVTILFVVTGAAYLVRASVDRDPVGRASDVLHVAMSFSMLSMPWAWGMTVFPPVLQIIVFSLATLFYLVLLLATAFPAKRTDPEMSTAGHHHSGRLRVAFHAFMMAAMVVMAILMNGSGHDHMGGGEPAGSGSALNNAISLSFLIVFAFAAAWYVAALLRGRKAPVPARVNLALMSAMCAGMSLGFWPIW